MTTFPGIHAAVNMTRDNFTLKEIEITNALGSVFYVTGSGQVSIKNADYRYISARPAGNLEHIVPNAREFLILFSDYENFEARTLDGFIEAEADFEPFRLNRHFRFLWSNDNGIRDKLKQVFDKEPDLPVTIPFTYKSFNKTDILNIVIDGVRNNYHFRDLFSQKDPLRESTFFYGRTELLSQLRDIISQGQNSGIFGLRKSGKTSTLLAAERTAKTDGLRVVHIDCQNSGITTGRWNDLAKQIAEKIRSSAGLATTALQMGDFSPANAANSLERAIKDSYSAGKRGCVITFDEIEHISPNTGIGHWKTDTDPLLFWQTIRSIHQSNPGKFSFILAGTNPIITETRSLCGVDNPLLEYVHSYYISGLSDKEVSDMCADLGHLMGMEFTVSAISELYKALGGHAYLTRQICSNIHHSISDIKRPTSVSEALTKSSIDHFNFSGLLDDILSSLKERFPDEYALLQWAALEDNEQIEYFLKEDPFISHHLVGYGLVVVESGTLKPRMGIATDHLRRMAKTSGVIRATSDRWAVIAKKRGELEISLRGILRNRMIDIHGRSGAADGIKTALTARRKNDLEGHTLESIFSDSNCPLYWTDLISHVKNDRAYWAKRLGLDDSVILSAMNNININRSDAHAVSIEDEDFDHLIEGIESLKAAL